MRQLVLNDVSITDAKFAIPEAARVSIEILISVIATLVRDKFALAVLRSTAPLEEIAFPNTTGGALDYGFIEFCRDRRVDPDLRRFLLSLSMKVPLLEGDVCADLHNQFHSTEFFAGSLSGPSCAALGLALLIDAIGVSVNPHLNDIWETSELTLCSRTLDDGGEVIEGPTATIHHAASPDHCEQIARRLRERRRDGLKNGSELWSMLDEIFPTLQFSPDVETQLHAIPRELVHFVTHRLTRMEECAKRWRKDQSPYPPQAFGIKNESEATLQQYSGDRTFRLPGGGTAVFALHTAISSRHRIHFIIEHAARTFVIGYVGDHLPTVKYS